jgi:DNA-binding transcriptional LysR family regulator
MWLRKCSYLQLDHAMMQPMVWDDLRVFLAVHRLGSHKAAARLLGIDPTTVGRRLAALEAALGARLALRTPDGLRTTPAGAKLVPHAERMEAEALESKRALEGADARLEGWLRVTAADGFIQYVLLPRLEEFRREHPRVFIDLRADHRVLDLSRREADIAIRLVRPKEPALVARRLGEMRSSLFASEAYLTKRGAPRNVAALAGHDFIGFDASLDDLPQMKWLRRIVPEPHFVLRATTTAAQVAACAEGHGIALLPSFVAPREPRLHQLLPRLVGPSRDMWAVTHGDLRTNARTSTFIAWVTRVAADMTTLL